MKKAIVHGANIFGKEFYMRSNYIFDICAFIDRGIGEKEFYGIPIYNKFHSLPDKNVDYIFVAAGDYDGVLREYERILGKESKTRIMSILYGYQLNKQQQFFALANEVHRKNIPGAAVELGVHYGDTAKYINLIFENRKLYLFDTFEGFSEQDKEYERSLQTLNETEALKFSFTVNENDVLQRMYYPEQCVIKKGRFPESLNGLEDTFVFAHIDCDLSKPIHDALEYFYPRLSEGGYICVHDYFSSKYIGVCKVVRDFADANGAHMVPVTGYRGAIISK